MKLAGLSIFGRTFFLMLAALLVAEGIGVALLLTRPQSPEMPPRLSEVSRVLSGERSFGAFSRAFRNGSGDASSGTGPPDFGSGGPGGPAPRGPPPGGFDGPGPQRASAQSMRVRLREATAAPAALVDGDQGRSALLLGMRAQRLDVPRDSLRLWAGKASRDGVFPGLRPEPYRGSDLDPSLADGFIAAYEYEPGHWRVAEGSASHAQRDLERKLLWLSALGVVLLLPFAWLFARALAAPIRRFSDAARRLGTETSAAPVPREGPPEMLAAIDSFNAMQSRLQRLLQERAHMVGAIAHDLRTPLTRLAFRLDDLQSPLKEKVDGDIQEMKRMISAALDFIRDRSLSGQREKLDLRLLVESVVDDRVDVGHDVAFEPGVAVGIEGDPVALRRMVENLVDNALKYGERARLRLVDATRERAVSVLEIDDDGPGIPEALQERVFEPFFRAEGSRNKDTGGFGLGLASVRSIVLDHGGSITLRSRKDGGLRVSVALPLPAR